MSLERHRLIWLYLKEKTNFFTAPIKMLHIAPEYCFIRKFKAMKNLDYTTGDIESPWADVKMDIHHIPFEDNTFDFVMCNHVLEHVDDDILACREILRVLKPGAFAILQSPIEWHRATTYEDKSITDPKEREKHFLQDDHLRIYGRDYGDRLRSAGFIVKEDDFVKSLPAGLAQRYALPTEELIYFCTKPAL
jgi:SAM-dependent methyltransferase